ncbi:CRISPR-associated helicase Cas3' [Pseudoflavonifractor sp.]|jgi:CRISPR-associated endonuclease/helicase Cas3|uniref:CRISPR-associated helicase Cas3' n=1 Tax=Pseudoflavonifractor sp. TaxID=1980281 RepID=UPI003D8E6F2C
MRIGLLQVWAKTEPFQSILTHSELSGIVAQVIVKKAVAPGVRQKLLTALSCTDEVFCNWIGYLVSLHDIGKVEGQFQYRWPPMKERMDKAGLRPVLHEESIRHEKTTWRCLRERIWRTAGHRSEAKFYADILAAHHQGKSGAEGERQNPFWNSLQEELEHRMRLHFLHAEELFLPALEKKERGSVGALLLGIVILSDWIASSDYFAQAETWFGQPDGQEYAERLAEQFLEASGLAAQTAEFGTEFCDVWPNIPKGGMRGLQTEVETLFRQAEERISLVLLEAPMGEGKTEAGVYAALHMARQWGKQGFYVGLPTAATSNQMVGRMRALLELHRFQKPVRLLHSTAWLAGDEDRRPWPGFETEEACYAARWILPVRRGLLGSYAVGTVDQAMMSVLLVKYGVLRLLGLAEKALVIDELHAYDVYMGEILHRLLEWCRVLEIPVVLLSATLPPEKKAQMLSAFTAEPIPACYPSVTAVTESGNVLVRPVGRTEKRQRTAVTLCPILHQAEDIAAKAVELTAEGGCLCVLLNTVRQAQEVYQTIKKGEFDGELMLFHARFPAGQREEIERHCIRLFGKEKKERPRKAILVATQVAEQSLDVDFDVMMTAIAPMDLLFQRLGRMFRHEDTPRPPHFAAPHLYVLTPREPGAFGADGIVYPACLLRQSIRLLEGRNVIRIPEDLPELVALGYDLKEAPPEELRHWLEHLMEDQVRAASSGCYLINAPNKGYTPIREAEKVRFDDLERSSYLSARTRLGEPTVRIALLPPERFRYFLGKSRRRDDGLFLSETSREETREILKASVSVRARLLRHGDRETILGEGLLEGVEIYPGTQDKDGNMWCAQADGSRIVADRELGIFFEGGDACAGVV